MPLRLRAPARNGEVLAEPGFDAIPDLVAENRRRLNRDDIIISNWSNGSLRQFRTDARTIAYIQALEYLGRPLPHKPGSVPLSGDAPLIVSGHQPDLFHPGVWAKNFALSGLARKLGGVGLNLIVDNDTAKANAVRVPVATGESPDEVGSSAVPFDTPSDLPYEEYRVRNTDVFATFAERVEAALPASIGEPLVRRAWEEVRRHEDQPVGEAFARARRMLEREWGCDNLELPVSRLAGTELFQQFLFNICAEAERFADVYNAAVDDYRHRHGIRSRSHPVPDLVRNGDWQEVPFWAWNERGTRRGRVWVRKHADRIA